MSTLSRWAASDGRDVWICRVGARTPLGFNAPASAAAVRGALSAISLHPIFVDKAGDSMGFARIKRCPPPYH